jgi:hypothetical protein
MWQKGTCDGVLAGVTDEILYRMHAYDKVLTKESLPLA